MGEISIYIVKSQPIDDIVYEVQRENDASKTRLLNRNMLLPFSGLPYTDESEEEDQVESIVVTPGDDSYTTGISDSSTEDEIEAETTRQNDQPVQKCAIPQRGDQCLKNNNSRNSSDRDRTQTDRQAPPRRGNRRRQLPAWMQSAD